MVAGCAGGCNVEGFYIKILMCVKGLFPYVVGGGGFLRSG